MLPVRRPPARGAALSLAAGLLMLAPACRATGEQIAAPDELPDLAALLATRPDLFGDILDRADEHRLKIECALVLQGPAGPTLTRSSFSRGPGYFYPASSVKTCAVISAFQALADLRRGRGIALGVDTPLRYHPLFDGESLEAVDDSNLATGTITAAHDMRKVMLVSDNAAYNRLYELAGPERVAASMEAAGLDGTYIVHRLSEFHSWQDQLRTPRVTADIGGEEVPVSAERQWTVPANDSMDGLVFGRAHVRGSKRVEGPMNFARKNFMALRDLLDMNVMLLQPEVKVPGRPSGAGIELVDGDRARIAEAMAQSPAQSLNPLYDSAIYPEEFSKFLLPGLRRMDARRDWIVRDKVGRAYGFSVTNGQIVDRETGRTLYVAATLYTNANGVVGDGVYEYDRADRFLADLGEVLGRAVFGGSSAQ